MKINFKHVAATAMAAVMSLSLSVSAFAAEVPTGTLTVTGNELAGKNVFAVRMFTAVANENEDSYIFTDYELEDKWLSFFEDIDYSKYNADSDNDTDITKPVDAKEALAYMEWLKNGDEEQWAAFAEDAQDWLYEQGVIEVTGEPENRVVSIAAGWSDLAAMETATEVEPVEVNEAPSGNATFESLTSGYYVVFPEGGSTGISNRGTDAMLINIPTDHAGATWNIKSTFPTVDKTVEDNNDNTTGDGANGSAQVGDTVTFTLTSKVPDMSDYDKFYFAFNDTLSKGLEFVEKTPGDSVVDANDVTVTIGSKTVTSGYSVSLSGKDLKIVFTDLKNGVTVTDSTVTTGAEIVVTYKAKITEAAVSDSGNIVGNAENDVYLEYSNNPGTTDKGTSTPDTSKVYTYDINVHKYANDVTYLANAVFALSKNGSLGTLSMGTGTDANKVVDAQGDSVKEDLIALEDNGDPANGTSYVVAPDGTNYTFTTNGTSAIKIQGLEAGTYYLYEVTAPTSYNKLKKPVKIEITLEDGDYTKPVYQVTINGKTTTGTQGNSTINVENKQGITLPETGSIGTIGLTVAGVAIVLLGVFAPRKKKKSNQE